MFFSTFLILIMDPPMLISSYTQLAITPSPYSNTFYSRGTHSSISNYTQLTITPSPYFLPTPSIQGAPIP